MEDKLKSAIQKALEKIGATDVAFTVETPQTAFGDYATNAALLAAKSLQKNPKEVAGALQEELQSSLGDMVAKIEVAGPGFINFTLSKESVSFLITEADAKGETWGTFTADTRRICFEYSNPNPFKEMHIGHLMSNVVGEAMSRLIENSGARVVRDTFGGDVGPHVAKALWFLQKEGVTQIESAKQIGDAYAKGATAYEDDEEIKQEIDTLNARIYDIVAKKDSDLLPEEDAALLSLWRQGREVSMEAFRTLFKKLGTKMEYELFDSDTTEGGMRIVHDGLEKGIFEKSEGAIVYRGEKKGLHTLVFITSRGTPTYETKDIGLAFLKEEKIGAEENYIVTAIEQVGHFEVMLSALSEVAPLLAKKTHHIPHGLLRLPTGKMASRKGNVITAEGLIAELIQTVSEKNPDPLVAEAVAIGAIKYMILRQTPGQDIIFDIEKSLSLEGDSGPYVQYALVRAKSILKEAEKSGAAAVNESPETPYEIERLLIHFPEVVQRATALLAPNLLVTYLTRLASEWNSFYAKERIIGGTYEAYKLKVARAFVNTMTRGLALLGMPVPEKM